MNLCLFFVIRIKIQQNVKIVCYIVGNFHEGEKQKLIVVKKTNQTIQREHWPIKIEIMTMAQNRSEILAVLQLLRKYNYKVCMWQMDLRVKLAWET